MLPHERVELALKLKEPDRVPRCELVIEDKVISEVTGKENICLEDRIAFMENMGLDAVCISPAKLAPPGSFVLPDACEELTLEEAAGRLEKAEYDYSQFERYRRESSLFVFALLNGFFMELSGLLGWERVMMALIRKPGEVKKAFQALTRKQLEVAGAAVKRGAGALIIGEDIAYQKGPLISPAMIRELFFPAWKEVVRELNKMNAPVVLHSEGNLEPLLPDIAGVFDGLHGLEPASGMSLKEVKKEYGDRLCLMGNIELSLLYPGGDFRELKEAVREAMESGAPGGGYIFGTTGGLCAGLSPDRILALFGLAAEYGVYPR